jgi:hypothetical protein
MHTCIQYVPVCIRMNLCTYIAGRLELWWVLAKSMGVLVVKQCLFLSHFGQICRQLFVSAIGCGLVRVVPLMIPLLASYLLRFFVAFSHNNSLSQISQSICKVESPNLEFISAIGCGLVECSANDPTPITSYTSSMY